MLRVVDIMSRNIVIADKGTTAQQVASLMKSENVSSILVTENGLPIGIVTETDITRDIVAEDMSSQTPVDDIMSSPLYSTRPDADIIEVANAMTTNRVKKIPVIDGDSIIGIITQTDIVMHVFRAVRSLERAHNQGQLTTQQYADKFSNLFHDFNQTVDGITKNWYMRCDVCGNTFMNPEYDGTMSITKCPRCGSTDLKYDPSPSV